MTVLVIFACRKPNEHAAPTTLQGEMRDVYAVARKLYPYVWSPDAFLDQKNTAKISALLEQLSNDFHKVEIAAPLTMFEPGFRVTLQTHREMIKDIRDSFAKGDKEYANWKLRGLTANCVACHSRYEVPVDFVGKLPVQLGQDFEAQMAQAEFLFATRQFDQASESLITLAVGEAKAVETSHHALQAIKLWLVIQVRVKNTYTSAAEKLTQFLLAAQLTSDDRKLVERWIVDLNNFAGISARGANLERARTLLKPVAGQQLLTIDEENLIKTLYASSLLHQELLIDRAVKASAGKLQPGNADLRSRRQATYLLALAYFHLPIKTFDAFRELYLEQTIREFPHTREAERAFLMYQSYLEFQYSGSAGLNLDAKSQRRLQELRNLAFGNPSEVMISN
ncbi:hypothetical protein JNK13_01815 [bacterium]|nr:hypothetical protein [bacterium]